MIRRARWTAPVGLILVVGCSAAQQSKSHLGDRGLSGTQSKIRNSQFATYDPRGHSRVDTLTVNADTIEAVDLCRQRRGELERQAQALALPGYRAYVERHSGDADIPAGLPAVWFGGTSQH